MACSFPMFRLSWSEALSQHRLAPLYERRVHNDGVILQRPEAEMIKRNIPFLAIQCSRFPAESA